MTPIEPILDFLAPRFPKHIDAAIVLGSGLGAFASAVGDAETIETRAIPGYPISAVEGHGNRVVIGTYAGRNILVFAGRLHLYEGHTAEEAALPARIAARFGIGTLIVTNAAGGLNPRFEVGDFMLITDYLVLPESAGFGGAFGPQMDASGRHQPVLAVGCREGAHRAALQAGFSLREGTYGFLAGPSYETCAEIAFFRTCGADAVGMSTVPEIMVGRRAGIDVIGISCITNKARTVRTTVTHEEVIGVTRQAGPRFAAFADAFLHGA